MFKRIAHSHGLVTRVVLILMFCLFALFPLAALADGTGGAEPPAQDPDPGGPPGGDGLVSFGLDMLALMWLVP
jgi:hypothetical protein